MSKKGQFLDNPDNCVHVTNSHTPHWVRPLAALLFLNVDTNEKEFDVKIIVFYHVDGRKHLQCFQIHTTTYPNIMWLYLHTATRFYALLSVILSAFGTTHTNCPAVQLQTTL